jgi:hypothetical protein
VQEALREDADYRGVESHCHFRRLSDYESAAAAAGLVLETHVRYELPCERTPKDVLVFARTSR